MKPVSTSRSQDMRYSNTSGKIIPMHHAFLTIKLSSFARVSTLVLPIFFIAVIWLFMPMIASFWGYVMEFWMQKIYGGHVSFAPVRILGQTLDMPFPNIEADDPSSYAVKLNMFICAIAFLVSFILPPRIAPFTYLLRAALIIQASASLDRMITPDNFPYTMRIYMLDALSLCVYLIFLMPVILGFVYYIFDFALWRKIGLTLLILGYFLITIPCQYMLHTYFIHEWTLLFLPIMYLLFGTLLNVLMFVCLYAYGMSWKKDEKSMLGRNL